MVRLKIHPKIARSQCIGGIVGGIGMALHEIAEWDDRLLAEIALRGVAPAIAKRSIRPRENAFTICRYGRKACCPENSVIAGSAATKAQRHF
jgi:hypothetical protein